MIDVKKFNKEVAHIKGHQAAFNKLFDGDEPVDVERYWSRYYVSYPDLYQRVCKELGIEPR